MGLRWWRKEKEPLACVIRSSELSGFFSKELEVPGGSRFYAVFERGERRVASAGEAVEGSFSGVLTRALPFSLPFNVSDAVTREGFEASLSFLIELEFGDQELEFEALRGNLLRVDPRLNSSRLHRHMLDPILRVVRSWLARTEARSVVEALQDGLRGSLMEGLKEALFDGGLLFVRVFDVKFQCAAVDRLIAKEAETHAQVEEAKREEEARDEVSKLRKDQMLKSLEYEKELSGKLVENKVERYEALRERLGGDETRALIALLEDEDAKAELIESLVESKMSPEQIRARRLEEIESRMQEKYDRLLKAVAARAAIDTDHLTSEKRMVTRRLLVALGKQVLSFDPTTNIDPNLPKETYDFRDRDLGYVRSVRAYRRADRDEIYAGAQRGIYRVIDGEVTEFSYPETPQRRGGVNSVAVYGEQIFATHSEMGLYAWDDREITPGLPFLRQVTRGSEAVRGVFVDQKANLFFSAGREVLRYSLIKDREPVVFRGSREPVTSFLVSGKHLIAGDRAGRIVLWRLDDPNSPRQFRVLKPSPIYMLKSCLFNGLLFLLIGSKDYGITAALLDGDRDIEFRCSEQIRWVAGASDMVYGVDRAGYRINCWSPRQPGQLNSVIRVADSIQDIYVIKEKESSG